MGYPAPEGKGLCPSLAVFFYPLALQCDAEHVAVFVDHLFVLTERHSHVWRLANRKLDQNGLLGIVAHAAQCLQIGQLILSAMSNRHDMIALQFCASFVMATTSAASPVVTGEASFAKCPSEFDPFSHCSPPLLLIIYRTPAPRSKPLN